MGHLRCWPNHDAARGWPIVVNCFYVNPVTGSLCLLEQRSVMDDSDGIAAAEQLLGMLQDAMDRDALSFTTVLMDKFCAARSLLLLLDELELAYWFRVRDDWAVIGDIKRSPHQEAQLLTFNSHTLTHGKLVVPVGSPPGHEVRLFKVGAGSCATSYVATNQLTQDDVEAAQLMCELLDTGRSPVCSYL